MGHTTEKAQGAERAREVGMLSALQLCSKLQEQNYPGNNLTTLAAWTTVRTES